MIIAGDIDRGGVIANLVGTHVLLDAADNARIRGFIINKFRGDTTLFDPAMRMIEERTGWPGIGILPWFDDAHLLPAEDALGLKSAQAPGAPLCIAVPNLSRIANFDDLDPLKTESDVDLDHCPRMANRFQPNADLVIIPGSKSTIADLRKFKAQGWDIDLMAHRRRGGHILGLCGGYQMLGTQISDTSGIEGPIETVEGLGHLQVETELDRR